MTRIEKMVRELVAAGAELDIDQVVIAPTHGHRLEGTFAVVDQKHVTPTSHGPAQVSKDGSNAWVQWRAFVDVRFEGDERDDKAVCLVTRLLANMLDEIAGGIDARVEVGTSRQGGTVRTSFHEYSPETKVAVATVTIVVLFDKDVPTGVDHVESVRIGIDHEPPTPAIRERVDVGRVGP